MKVIFIVPYPTEGASYRYRVQQYLPYLKSKDVDYSVSSFVSSKFYVILYKPGYFLKKCLYFLERLICRVFDFFRAFKYDLIFIHLEALPIGPPILEWLWAKFGKSIVFDLDDAIYMRRKVGSQNRLVNYLKCPAKIPKIIKLSSRVIVCNDYLKKYTSEYISEDKIDIIPTSVDLAKFTKRTPHTKNEKVIIGWIGSRTTAIYLDLLKRVFQDLSKKYNFVLKIVGAGKQFKVSGVEIFNQEWSLSRDVEDFHSLDIGVYPLPDDEWVKGKTGFKTVQYMSVGVPCVSSNVGRNKQIIQDGVNGFLANSEEEWIQKLSRLIEDHRLRDELGRQGRQTVEESFSLKVNAPRMLTVLEKVCYESKKTD